MEKGKLIFIEGTDGAGKTTAMNIIAGLTIPTSGEVLIKGNGVGLLPENPPLYLNMKVGEFLTFVAEINGVQRSILKDQVKDKFGTLVTVGIVSILALQVVINIGMVSGLFPVVGLTLPFISYGRTSFLIFAIMMGFPLNLSKKRTVF